MYPDCHWRGYMMGLIAGFACAWLDLRTMAAGLALGYCERASYCLSSSLKRLPELPRRAPAASQPDGLGMRRPSLRAHAAVYARVHAAERMRVRKDTPKLRAHDAIAARSPRPPTAAACAPTRRHGVLLTTCTAGRVSAPARAE